MNRSQRRAATKVMGKKGMEEVSRQLMQFGNLPDACTTCTQAFDKKDKEMVLSWHVTVRQDAIHLFCPECMDKVKEIFDERD